MKGKGWDELTSRQGPLQKGKETNKGKDVCHSNCTPMLLLYNFDKT